MCDLLHCLPSQLESETEEHVVQLRIYFGAKALWQKREQAKSEAEQRLASKGGPHGG